MQLPKTVAEAVQRIRETQAALDAADCCDRPLWRDKLALAYGQLGTVHERERGETIGPWGDLDLDALAA